MPRNAIIVAAGKSNRLAPFTYEKPKGLFRVKGEILIERQIEQLREAGIEDIYVVVGYMKEKFFYLERKYRGLHLVINNESGKKENLLSADKQLEISMEYLHRLHSIPIDDASIAAFANQYDLGADFRVKTFDDVEEGKKLMRIASATKGNLVVEFADMVEKVERLYGEVKEDAERIDDKKVLCHNDTSALNYLIDDRGEIFLIDWEYACINYGANDISCILRRYDWTDEQVERYLRAYVGRELTEAERCYFYAFIPICGFYWFDWGLYKGSVGDDDGFFFTLAYRNFWRYIDRALESYGLSTETGKGE